MKKTFIFTFFLSICFLTSARAQFLLPQETIGRGRESAFADLLSKSSLSGSVHVIVHLNADFVPEGSLSKSDATLQRLEIKNAQGNFLNRYRSLRAGDVKQFTYIPYLAFEADTALLGQLRDDASVAGIEEDRIGDAALAESTQIVGATTAWGQGFSGSGQTVAILDSGVDKTHNFLSGRIISEACFSSNNASSTSFCPGGATSSTASNSGLNCPANIDGCAHGTNVAGIAAGRGTTFSGVAKDANIIAIQMFSQFTCNGAPCARYWTSDLILALERVRTLSQTMGNIAAVNLSLQTGEQYTSNCDSAHSATKAAIDNLRSANIATAVCAGNYGFTNALTAPACISSSISVGSTDDGSFGTALDSVSNFSDSSPLLHILAPGRWINSSIPGNAYQNYSGTSMATPHVVGALAVLRQKKPNATINQMLNAMITTGQPIVDTRNNITKPRLRVAAALNTFSGTTSFDFDNDSKTDVGIFRPSTGAWWIQNSSNNQTFALQFGSASDKLVPADYTGDSKTDVAFFRPSTGQWFVLRSEDFSFYGFQFGTSDDVPVPADFDGDGKTDAAVFRPSTASWYVLRSSGGVSSQNFGFSEDKPVAADYDGDSKADIAIFRPSTGAWWIQKSSDNSVTAIQFGQNGDKTVQGDYTGDGKADLAFFRPSNGFWYILRSNDNSFYGFSFGAAEDLPVSGDYDGDGKFDPAVYRPSNSGWYMMRSTSGTISFVFGASGDVPVANAFVRQ